MKTVISLTRKKKRRSHYNVALTNHNGNLNLYIAMDKNEEEKNEQSISVSFKKIVLDWFTNLNVYGLPKIFRNENSFSRIIWIICFIISFIYCMHTVGQLLQNYYSNPSYISTEIVQEIPTPFPAITICNIKLVNRTRSSTYLDANVLNFDLRNFTDPYSYIITQEYSTKLTLNSDSNLTNKTKKELGFLIEDMLISCYFNYIPCTAEDFTYSYSLQFGNCYTFNKGIFNNGSEYKIKQVGFAGPTYGLSLELFLGNPPVDTVNEYRDGIYVSINNQSTIPFTQGDIITAPAGAETNLIVNRNFISKLEKPYGNCLKDTTNTSKFNSIYFRHMVENLAKYNQEYCLLICEQDLINKKCNCTNELLPAFQKLDFCENETQILCMADILDKFGESSLVFDCQTDCPIECDSIEYKVTSYRALYPNEFYTNALYKHTQTRGMNISLENIPKAFSKLNVYYQSMQYTRTIQTISIAPVSLFSNLFSTINFFTGLNIFTAVEVFELAFNLVNMFIFFIRQKRINIIQNRN